MYLYIHIYISIYQRIKGNDQLKNSSEVKYLLLLIYFSENL